MSIIPCKVRVTILLPHRSPIKLGAYLFKEDWQAKAEAVGRAVGNHIYSAVRKGDNHA